MLISSFKRKVTQVTEIATADQSEFLAKYAVTKILGSKTNLVDIPKPHPNVCCTFRQQVNQTWIQSASFHNSSITSATISMQKLRNISRNISSFRPSRFLKTKPENEKEKDIAGDSTSPRAEQNGVVGGVEGPRLNNSEERTLTSETPNEPSSPTTNASHRGVREGEGGVNIKRATRTRRIMIIISSLFHLLSVIFLILVRIPLTTPQISPTKLTSPPQTRH